MPTYAERMEKRRQARLREQQEAEQKAVAVQPTTETEKTFMGFMRNLGTTLSVSARALPTRSPTPVNSLTV